VRQFHGDGFFEYRNSAKSIADLLGVSRATVYNYAR
jgi:predicted transcriptional regulator YheO